MGKGGGVQCAGRGETAWPAARPGQPPDVVGTSPRALFQGMHAGVDRVGHRPAGDRAKGRREEGRGHGPVLGGGEVPQLPQPLTSAAHTPFAHRPFVPCQVALVVACRSNLTGSERLRATWAIFGTHIFFIALGDTGYAPLPFIAAALGQVDGGIGAVFAAIFGSEARSIPIASYYVGIPLKYVLAFLTTRPRARNVLHAFLARQGGAVSMAAGIAALLGRSVRDPSRVLRETRSRFRSVPAREVTFAPPAAARPRAPGALAPATPRLYGRVDAFVSHSCASPSPTQHGRRGGLGPPPGVRRMGQRRRLTRRCALPPPHHLRPHRRERPVRLPGRRAARLEKAVCAQTSA